MVNISDDSALSVLSWIIRSYKCVHPRSIRFKAQYGVNKIEFYCNTRDKTAVLCNSVVVYTFSCPGCGANYIGKTERTVDHAWTNTNCAVCKYINDSTGV